MVLNVQTQEILKRGIKKIRTICDSPILNNVEKIISDESFDLESLKDVDIATMVMSHILGSNSQVGPKMLKGIVLYTITIAITPKNIRELIFDLGPSIRELSLYSKIGFVLNIDDGDIKLEYMCRYLSCLAKEGEISQLEYDFDEAALEIDNLFEKLCKLVHISPIFILNMSIDEALELIVELVYKEFANEE